MTHDVQKIRGLIKERDSFYITGHINPDGDSIGACFGLGLALQKMGKVARVLLDPFHPKYNVIPGRHLMDNNADIDESFVLICVDCADAGRLSSPKLIEILSDTVCIDHHYSNTHFAKYNFVDGIASSACEMVHRILDGFVELDLDIASALYAGMISDTGGFRHNATSKDTLQAAAKLMATGIPFTEIYTELVHLRSYTEVKLLGRVLDCCCRSTDGRIVHVCVTKAMRSGLEGAPDATIQDLEGVVEYLLNIRGTDVSLLIYDRGHNDEVKISLRSRSINVGAIAQHFGGGGHKLAAGATVKGSGLDLYALRDKVLHLVQQALDA